jgi:hypothetical protein
MFKIRESLCIVCYKMIHSPWPAPGELQHDHISLKWLRENFVDAGASKIFLALSSLQQETIRRAGGLGRVFISENSRKLMGRIHNMYGFVHVMTATTSHSARSRSRSGRRSLMTTHHPSQAAASSVKFGDDYSEDAMTGHCNAVVAASTARVRVPPSKPPPPPPKTRVGFFKGEGKGSLGFALDQQSFGGSISKVDEVKGSLCDPIAPPPVRQTNEQVETLLSGSYYTPMPLVWQGPDISSLKYEDNVLWAGVKSGKNGGQSTVKEYFHGTFWGFADLLKDWAYVS